jgi:hypothetical protein
MLAFGSAVSARTSSVMKSATAALSLSSRIESSGFPSGPTMMRMSSARKAIVGER